MDKSRNQTIDKKKIFIIAGEESGDILGARLMSALKLACPHIDIKGIGGQLMTKEGLASFFPMNDISVTGVFSVFRHLPKLLKHLQATSQEILETKPEILVLIDSPDFNHRIAKKIRKKNKDIKIISYVAPSVWAWRQGRARKMRDIIDYVLAILPFEPAFMEHLGGPSCTYIGHQALLEVADETMQETFLRQFSLSKKDKILALCLGSRYNEIYYNADAMLQAAGLLKKQYPRLKLFVPLVASQAQLIKEKCRKANLSPTFITDNDDKRALYSVATAALCVTGTITLELGLAQTPMVGVNRLDKISNYFLARLAKIPSFVLVNLVVDAPIVPECLASNVTPDKILKQLAPLFASSKKREQQIIGLKMFVEAMGQGRLHPARKAAKIILDL